MPNLIQGRVVWADVRDPQGHNDKNRKCVVISTNDEIASSQRIVLVGITTKLQQSPADHYVHLQYGTRCWTGLSQPSAALCSWTIGIDKNSVEVLANFLRPDYTTKILDAVSRLVDAGQAHPVVEM